MDLRLQHKQQPLPWGCQYYALYSLVGDERILQDTTECSAGRFRVYMARLGYHLHPIWVDQTDVCATGPDWWRKAYSQPDIDRYADAPGLVVTPLLADIDSASFAGVMHRVGLAILLKPGLPVLVFDPALAEKQEFETMEAFLVSPYSRCYHVYEVHDGSPDYFTSSYGPDAPHVTPEVRKRWEEHQVAAA